MQIMNTFVAKIGPGGKRNRAARRRMERRGQGKQVQKPSENILAVFNTVVQEEIRAELNESLDLSVAWDESLARKALNLFAESGKSQRAFAAEHGFPESRLRSWKKKFETLALN